MSLLASGVGLGPFEREEGTFTGNNGEEIAWHKNKYFVKTSTGVEEVNFPDRYLEGCDAREVAAMQVFGCPITLAVRVKPKAGSYSVDVNAHEIHDEVGSAPTPPRSGQARRTAAETTENGKVPA